MAHRPSTTKKHAKMRLKSKAKLAPSELKTRVISLSLKQGKRHRTCTPTFSRTPLSVLYECAHQGLWHQLFGPREYQPSPRSLEEDGLTCHQLQTAQLS